VVEGVEPHRVDGWFLRFLEKLFFRKRLQTSSTPKYGSQIELSSFNYHAHVAYTSTYDASPYGKLSDTKRMW